MVLPSARKRLDERLETNGCIRIQAIQRFIEEHDRRDCAASAAVMTTLRRMPLE
ncbi:MAG: hypothetical protein QM755_20600 [Luteolibacter sp.]